ncbi:MAG: hypothetical protein WC455_13065 [Dehalococcoidia bacterium]|jgi:hypothetical protein
MKKELNVSIGPLGIFSLLLSAASLTVGLLGYFRSKRDEGEVGEPYEETEV